MRIAFCTAAMVMGLLIAGHASAHPDYGCESCHVPHNSLGDHQAVPLWNPAHSETSLQGAPMYTSTTLDVALTGPTGASKLCLSCHDGSQTSVGTDHTFASNMGMGAIENSHPISFSYSSAQQLDAELVPVDELPAGALDGNGDMQCVSCHDVHATAATYARGDSGNNLRWKYDNELLDGGYVELNNAAFCRTCHRK